MKIDLFEHNQVAYESAVSMMNETGKAAVIHPTGTGKSLIAFKLAMDNPGASVCWLAPSSYIYHTQLENLQKITHLSENESPQNITFISYSKLMHNEDLIEKINPDYIILDEFHRCGAAEWGKSVKKLLEAHKTAKILGLSATNIRYLDNQRDMADELFDGCVASEMTLGEAMARGILVTPKYVMAMYSYGEELKKLEQRIRSMEKQSNAKKNLELLEELRRALEKADGPDKIFAKHMSLNGRNNGKYIVFCSSREHMDEMITHMNEWFALVDPDPHMYVAYYSNPETSKAFAEFKADKSDHLKLLYCIDMLNEGVHVDDIDGVILLRPTVSPIIYMQQIGRCLSAGTRKTPVIFDLVDNFDSLYSIDCLTEEIDQAFALMPCTQIEREKFKDRFFIYDEVKECRQLFGQLRDNLSSTWDNYYLAACAYHKEHGNLKIAKDYVTADGMTLGSWIQTQRKVYSGKIAGGLTADKIEKLNLIGMIWNVRKNSFDKAYEELQEYHRQYGNLDIKARYVSNSGFALGKWVSNLRGSVRKKGIDAVLTKEQQDKLNELGMIWDKNGEIWDVYISAAKEYYDATGNLQVPVKYVTEDGIALGNWIASMKSGMSGRKLRSETLTDEQKEQLTKLGLSWEKNNVTVWNSKFELAKDYYRQHGNLNIPVAYCVNGVKLGRWISNIRSKRKNPGSSGMVLDESRIKMLDSIGMDWK
ncbi:Helicase associated domain protein [Agathobacter sp.]